MSVDLAPYGTPEWEAKIRADREKWAAADRILADKVTALAHRADAVAAVDVDDLTDPAALRAAVVDLAAVLVGTLALIRDEITDDEVTS